MNRDIYKRLAKKYGVSVDEIERDIQDAINASYEQPACVAHEEKAVVVEDYGNLISGSLKQMIMELYTKIGGSVFANESTLTEFKNKDFRQLHEYHFGLGMYLRNNALTSDSELYKAFKASGISERDAMSTAIIQVWHTALQQEK